MTQPADQVNKKRRRKRGKRGGKGRGNPAQAVQQTAQRIEPSPKPAPKNEVTVTIEDRHFEILEWICNATGKTPAEVCTQFLRSELIKHRPKMRDAQNLAQGKPLGSSQDIENFTN